MSLDLTFKQVCDLIKKDSKQDPRLIDAVDKLLGLALVCSPVVLGPAAVALLPTLAVKNEIVKLGRGVFDSLTKKKDRDYVGRLERMKLSYGLIVFTVFFDALDSMMSSSLREKIGLIEPEKAFLAKEAVAKTTKTQKALPDICDRPEAPLATAEFAFPHPTETLTRQTERHGALWKQMGQGFNEFIQKLAVWEQAGEKERAQMLSWSQKLPEEAGKLFEAQYFELSRRFEDFAVWSNLQEHKATKELVHDLSEYVKAHARLSQASDKLIDIGFSNLHSAVLDIPETLKITQSSELVESLTKHYQARVNDAIIEDKEEPQEGKPRLSFPRICDAFIPQAFSVLRQSGKGQQLEDEETWQKLPRRNDLGAFLLSYLTSPYSTETPLLILGHPGSGKSLLTTVLSSQLMSKHFTAIRVPLREVNAEAGIVTQIEDAIRRITNISVDSWAKLSGAFKNSPPLVILDGYDELLQASGKVFAGYLKDVQNFQKNEAEQGRPVRVIVTSRVTLIDKATVPSGATIVRLLEFNESQREHWISIWNNTNVNYFREARIEEFALPDKEDAGSLKILALAEQPLLLLMLALYDSQENQLRKSRGLDRTRLYDSLLRRFVTRERGKEKGFDDSKPAERKKVLDTEMQRLGVAALGMYNRRKVHILGPELNDDLKFFNLERKVSVTSGRPLSEADLLLGSFFFVHKSKAQHSAGAVDIQEEISAFEFLHNTFGEFLTADFILRRAVAQVEALRAFQANDALREAMEKMLNSANGFGRDWFASLVYTPLFTRPVVLEMMREWIGHILKERSLPLGEFLNALDTIILNQLKRLLNKREMPSIICTETAQEGYRALFGDHPLLGHIAIYSVNLILLRVIVSDQPFVFEESRIDTHEDGARPWDRLAHIWRAWFSIDNLNGVTAVMLSDRIDSQISVRAKIKFKVAESQKRLETYLGVALSLGDNISSGLAGLLLFESSKDNQLEIDDIAKRLLSERIDVDFQVAMKQLFQIEQRLDPDGVDDFTRLARIAVEMALRNDRLPELEHVLMSFRRGMRRVREGVYRWLGVKGELRFFRELIDPSMAAEASMRNPQVALLLSQIAEEVGDDEWIYRFQLEFFEFVSRRLPPDMFDHNPEVVIVWSQIARRLGNSVIRERYEERMLHPELFERALDLRYLLELSDHHPEAALAWVRLVRDLSGRKFFEIQDRDFFLRRGDALDLLRLIERNPEAGLTWLQIAREVGGRFYEEMRYDLINSGYLEGLLRSQHFLELAEHNPEAALALVFVAQELEGEGFRVLFDERILRPDFFERALHPRRLLELSERNPESVLAWAQLVRELGRYRFHGHLDERLTSPEAFERAIHPGQLLEFAERNPQAALTWLNVMEDLGGHWIIERPEQEFFESGYTVGLSRFLHTKPAAFAVALRLTRITRSPRMVEAVIECLSSASERFGWGQSVIETLPIGVLPDIEWIAAESNNGSLRSAVRRLRQKTEPALREQRGE